MKIGMTMYPRYKGVSRSWMYLMILCLFQVNHRSTAFAPNCPSKIGRKRRRALSVSLMDPEGKIDEDSKEPEIRPKKDFVRDSIRGLAELSLKDYNWRNSVFKENEADRKVEESIARMMGEDASYMRPMDASEQKIGPLGKLEKSAVEWLSQVIDEEGRRAKKIVKGDGELIRPMNAGVEEGELGPLGYLEKCFVDFLESIRNSEQLRAKSGVLRPKDLDATVRGPLGDLEVSVVSALKNIREAEVLRMEQSRQRGGEIVRPIDVPGPLGDFEMAVIDIMRSEQKRSKDGITRPKDSKQPGALGEIELQAVQIVQSLNAEERERLRNIRTMLENNRPMVQNRNSILGVAEALFVGILRAPKLMKEVFSRVSELIQSEKLENTPTFPKEIKKSSKKQAD